MTKPDNEQKTYACILELVNTLPAGVYQARDFFPDAPTCPRVVKMLFKDVKSGLIPRMSLVGTTSQEGYIIK